MSSVGKYCVKMTSLKQIEANRHNAIKSTGPRTTEGKRRCRQNAIKHGLTAETVIAAFEGAPDYTSFEASITSDYRSDTTTEQLLVARLASVLWRLRRSTSIETGMFQLQGELMANGNDGGTKRTRTLQPEWYGEFDVGSPSIVSASGATEKATTEDDLGPGRELACCFLRMSRLQYGPFDLLSRYETALWRQAAQLMLMLQPKRCFEK